MGARHPRPPAPEVVLAASTGSAPESCDSSVLCPRGCNGGNVLVAEKGDPPISRLVDPERASWDDRLRDLAKTRLHVPYHDSAGADVLTRAYGVDGGGRHRRLEVFQVLLVLNERT